MGRRRLPDLAGYPAMAGGRGDRPEYAGEGADARQTVPARGVRKSHQSQKHCFLAALFPQFILPHQPQVMQYIVLGVTTIVVDIIVMIGYATLAQRISAWIKGPKQMKALNKVFGSLFMLVGALLASARHA